MSGKPAARLSDPTACPIPGHGVNPIASGSADVLFDGLPAARQGDVSACGGALSGALSSTVFINGRPAATLGSLGSHGNTVIGGSGTVIIGDTHVPAPFVAPLPVQINWPFDQQFVVRSRSGTPLTGRAYTLITASGKEIKGVTDGQGKTAKIAAQSAESVTLVLEPQSSLLIA
ncbi:hypothetical protein DNK59_20225 [Pseudomonas sp. TKO26]|uniref:PAAR domain-containing protein n=1 Tax=unclassified Pseudomonas TaxID=196821 RepID=UPI000D8F59B1|nr:MULTISPECIES: PAAR domain-containing protein [unclassified Pseudomonas]PYY83054.1 hypothetical protein DNK62_20225 [Pseudomonas sp. TKO30]PYY84600.1 hypothetical protein DNK61_19600 [Pseudomonas sp. TKO29]PYY86898.1 hypothetical protein DNK59_20225 [Pseudomonas sp. TKO26]PYY98265.1 hypothetical protein DNK60_21075 [Pseudomonas sp. TKO14]